MRRIGSDADIVEGLEALTGVCPHLARVHALTGNPPLRKRPKGFEGLSRVVVGQQLSIASAEAIWGRVRSRVQPFEAATLLKVPEKDLRKAGLSRVKVETLRELAGAVKTGQLKLDALSRAPEDVIHAELTALKGIGPWTADIYIMFSLARADAWSPGDLALQYAVKDALLLAERPSLMQMNDVAEAWRPWRGVAARLLWSYYALRRKKVASPLGRGARTET
ncbi:MAG TPA: DNA-3-methyladenine glycosylase 2 family protein [Aestuariivirgaceae bacterium]|jgi:DNA-3-methyladenine glycosylase II